ncbi:DUF1802 family protein [Methanobrevibacter millerae]|uniref:Restriction endonuclease n=1 Tax=Methanobrevibacter millerae TaxID=230361 RepID=A0A1G5WG14_9EURY|nr:DUF1802 family protein [Methanobrevibacter millerae]SDA56993.1 hypothetical protein SAMN02910315_01381 [Methanobrevibacter millerae]
MDETTKCLNEWNATVEALGQGKQTILIRKYSTTLNEFLLYPTVSYAIKEDVLDSFQYKEFVKDNLLPTGDNPYEVKYYATVEEVIDKPSTRIGSFYKFHIWTRNHVKDYLGRKKAKIWILRVYKLDEPQMLKRTRGMRYANVDKPVKLEGKPVIPDDEFNKLKEEILNIR